MDEKYFWVLTALGKPVRKDKIKASDEIPESLSWHEGDNLMEAPNRFASKLEAINMRDNIISLSPNAFLPKSEPKKPGPKPRGKIVEQDEFREMMRSELMKRMDIFWQKWALLPPQAQCELYYKMFAYAYSKAPNEKVVDPATAAARKVDSKRAEAAERISQGLSAVEDNDFEE